MRAWSWGLAMALCAIGSGAIAAPLISEIYYDAVGADDGKVFVELYGDPGSSLEGLRLEGTNGSNGSIVFAQTLTGSFPADGFFVVADGDALGATSVAEADWIVGNIDHQNGPENLLLFSGETLIDALGFGAFGAGDVYQGEGQPAADAPAGSSLARVFANRDSGDNATDFEVLASPTPGTGPLAAVPEPGTAGLLLLGLGALAWRRQS